MANCEFCNKKLSILDNVYDLGDSPVIGKVCASCCFLFRNVKNLNSIENFNESYNKLLEYHQQNRMSEQAYNYLNIFAEQTQAKIDKIKQEENFQLRKTEQLRESNSLYEYTTESIIDENGGYIKQEKIQTILQHYATRGWRLHTIITNEVGKDASSAGYGGFSSGTNATIDQTILIFERRVRKGIED